MKKPREQLGPPGTKGKVTKSAFNDYRFTRVTLNNLLWLTEKHKIIWTEVVETLVQIAGGYAGPRNLRIGHVGKDIQVFGYRDKQEYRYHRKETGGASAGRTLLYKCGQRPIQVTKAIMMTPSQLDEHFLKVKPK